MTARSVYGLLPELYRRRDADAGHALRALCAVLEGAAATIEGDIAALYDNWFVETCEPWALPYIARLVGLEAVPEGAFDPRLLVADAIALARRKGTIPALEHRLSALSGWPVQVAFSAPKRMALVRYWGDPAFPLRRVPPRADGDRRFRFHPLGIDAQLFAAPRTQRGIETPFCEDADAPRPLERTRDALDAIEILVGDGEEGLATIPPAEMAVADLSDWAALPDDGPRAVVDPILGRFVLRLGSSDGPVAVSFAYPAAGRIGGGPYPRREAEPTEGMWVAYVHKDTVADQGQKSAPPVFASLSDALAAYGEGGADGLILILDSGDYELGAFMLDVDALPCAADPNRPRRLAIEALSGETPVLRGRLTVAGGGGGIDLSLRGLWLDGRIDLDGRVSARLSDCTVHLPAVREPEDGERSPPAIRFAGAADGVALALLACVTGPLVLGAGVALTIGDSIVDGHGGAAISGRSEALVDRATLLGDGAFCRLEGIDTLFDGAVAIENPDASRLAHCALLGGEVHAIARRCVIGPGKWAFRSTDFGGSGYARLKREASETLLAAASNGSEIGVFNEERVQPRLGLMAEALAHTLPLGIDYDIEAQ